MYKNMLIILLSIFAFNLNAINQAALSEKFLYAINEYKKEIDKIQLIKINQDKFSKEFINFTSERENKINKMIRLINNVVKNYTSTGSNTEYSGALHTNQSINSLLTIINAKDSDKNTALYYACQLNDQNIVKLLIDIGADVNITNCKKKTALHEVAILGHTEIAKLLIDNGADVNAKDKDNATPLHKAALVGDTVIAKLLIDNKANINIQDDIGYTPLHNAASLKSCNEDIIELLINNGANINAIDDEGCTSLHVAAWYDNKKIVELLLKYGIDKNIKDEQEETAVECAKTEEIEDLINNFNFQEYLKKYRTRPLKEQVIEFINKNRDRFAQDLYNKLPPELSANIKQLQN